jgi:hypothetical protein
MSEKKCSRCEEIKPLTDFKSWTDKNTGETKYRSECKACNKEYEKTYNRKYYEAVTVGKRRGGK